MAKGAVGPGLLVHFEAQTCLSEMSRRFAVTRLCVTGHRQGAAARVKIMPAHVEKVRGTFLATSIDLHNGKEGARVSFPQAPSFSIGTSTSRPRSF